jgi:molybdopterin converting factor subunit 1
MRITVRFFAVLKDRAGCAEALLDLPAGATISTATDALVKVFPGIQDHLPRIATAINRNYAKREEILHDGDELALIPPVSGGCGA